jgi:hypothetical protein
VTGGSDDCREDNPTGALIHRGRPLMLLELLDQFAVLSLYPINAGFMSIQSSVRGISSLIDSTHLGQLIGQTVQLFLNSEQSVLQFHIL